jgi:hypothetical protein
LVLIALCVVVIGAVVVVSAYLVAGVQTAIACSVLFAIVMMVLVGVSRSRASRHRCPECSANHPRLEGVISDGGEWECRTCGHTWR